MSIFIPKGFRFAGVHCGLKADPKLLDLSLIVSDLPATGAGVFTPNLLCGAPVQVDRGRLLKHPARSGGGFRAVVGNSRCANACTGEQGIRDAEEMASLAANAAGGTDEQGLVISTGVIGTMMPMDKVRKGIADAAKRLSNSEDSFLDAARGIMTTDTVEKYVSQQIVLSDNSRINIAGICKGAAMIAPNLATMLAVIMTDAALEPADAHTLLKNAADVSFNCITVEGHTSTSDTLLLLANGATSSKPLAGKDIEVFQNALNDLCTELAVKIPSDGEGITHLITVDVEGCKTAADARCIARKISEDVLVKTAICGADPNWGRIVSAAGTAGVPFNPKKTTLFINGIELFRSGEPLPFDKQKTSDSIRNNKDVHFRIIFGEGNEKIRFWTTDLTAEYVRLNSDYTT